MVAAYLIEPARRIYDLIELAADAGLAGGVRPGAEPRPALACGEEGEAGRRPGRRGPPGGRARRPPARPRSSELGLERLLNEVEMPLVEVLAAMERAGREARRRAPGRDRGGHGRADRRARDARSSSSPGQEFTIGSPQQVGEVLFEELGLTSKRRGKTGFSTDARVLAQIRDEHQIVDKIESWRELTKLKNTYLDALPELIDPETGRDPHHLQPGGDDDRPPLEHQPEPAEHPDPHRDRPPGPRLLRRRARRPPALRRLQPGRAARPRPRRRRGGAERDLRRRRGRPRARPRPRSSRSPRGGRRRPALEGEDGQLRDRLRADRRSASPTGSTSPARRRRNSSPATSSASRRSALHRRDDRQGASEDGLRLHADGPAPARSPSCAPANANAAASASGSPSTP